MMTRALGRTALLSAILLFSSCGGSSSEPTPRARWTDAEAEAWYASQAWLVGANFVPSTAINQLEMWQADTYDEATIDRELGWAAVLGFNTIRVFLHDLLWQEDSEAFLQRIDRFLTQADQHGISVMLVFFDGVWNPFPVAGPQPEPTPFVHNSQWVQSPGAEILGDFERHDGFVATRASWLGTCSTSPTIPTSCLTSTSSFPQP